MANNLIKNETNVFYTVQVNEGLYIQANRSDGIAAITPSVTNNKERAHHFNVDSLAKEAALYTKGKLIKHTQTTVVTEITEEIEIEVKEQLPDEDYPVPPVRKRRRV